MCSETRPNAKPENVSRDYKNQHRIMTITDIINLIGSKSTDQNILQWFEKYELKKPPKTINANQGSKSFDDKQNELSYYFSFDITNDEFYPPKSAKNDDYTFDCYLKSVSVFERNKKGNTEKPNGFWENYINPNSTYEECCTFFNNEAKHTDYYTFFRKSLNDIVEIKVWMTPNKEQIRTIELCIKEEVEIFSIYNFKENNEHNTVKQAYLLIVKWLFDNHFLLLSEEVYSKGLSLDIQEIRVFVSLNLLNHIWDNQIDLFKEPDLYKFLFSVNSNSNIELINGEKMNVYARNLFLQEAGVWEEHQRIYNDAYDTEKLLNLEKSTFLNEKESRAFVNTLTNLYNHYKTHKK